MRPGSRLLAVLLLPIVCYVAWDQAEQRALARDIAAIAARGEPITADTAPTGADTVERHDAARIYAAAAERVRAMPPDQTFRLGRIDVDATGGPPININIADLEKMYRPDAPALQLLDQATPLDFNGFGDVPLDPSNSPFNTLLALATLRADIYSARGDGEAAARALVPCVRLWRVLTGFSRYGAASRLVGSLRILLRHTKPSAESLAALQDALAQIPDTDDLPAMIRGRRAIFLENLDDPQATALERAALRVMRPYVTRLQRRQLATFDEGFAVAQMPWPAKFTAARELENRYADQFRMAGRRGFFARLLPIPGAGAIVGVNAAGLDLAARRVAIATLAVERYRRSHAEALPLSLDALVPQYLAAVTVDPFSGAPLVYKPSASGYVLYSIDTNLKDDDGAFYGIGSHNQLQPRQGAGRDLGIRVEYTK